MNGLHPEFVMSVGDLIVGWDEEKQQLIRDTLKIKSRWREFNDIISQLRAPFFYVGGNNDLLNPILDEEWKKRFGRTYYSFEYKKVLFLVLNSDDTPLENEPYISDEQIEWLKSVLDDNERIAWTLIFLHRPLWADAPNQWLKVKGLLKDRKHTVFAGHHHTYRKYTDDSTVYYQLATTGGVSDLSGIGNGRFDHISWVTMTASDPSVTNLLLDGIWSDNPIKEYYRGFEFTTAYYEIGLTRSIQKLDSMQNLNPESTYFSVNQMNLLVRQLINEGKSEAALKIARINSNEYPDSILGLNWLSQAQLANSDTLQAISTLQRILKIDPENNTARQMIDQLSKG